MKIGMVGAGYVGLVTGVCLSKIGHHVTLYDIDENKINSLGKGVPTIYEPGLDALLKEGLVTARFSVTRDLRMALAGAEIALIAVGTPSAANGAADLSFVEAAALQIACRMDPGMTIVTKSTVPVGTGRMIRSIVMRARPKTSFSVASNPEFLREGNAVHDFMNPDRVVIGSDDEVAMERLRELYAPLRERGAPILETSLESAELIKYASNAFLATKVAFINEVAALCEKAGIDVDDVATGVGLDKRIGPQFLRAGPGYGGSCFPKDTRAFASLGRRLGARQTIVEQVDAANQRCKARVADRITELLGGVRGKTVTLLGLAFKANTDDMREAVSVEVINALVGAGAKVRVHDYAVDAKRLGMNGNVTWCRCPYAAAENADLVAVLTDWADYGRLDLAKIAAVMAGRLVFDTRRIIAAEEAEKAGLELIGLGRARLSSRTASRQVAVPAWNHQLDQPVPIQ